MYLNFYNDTQRSVNIYKNNLQDLCLKYSLKLLVTLQ